MISVSIDKRPNGTYRVRWRDPETRAQRTKTFKTLKDSLSWGKGALTFRNELVVAVTRGTFTDPSAAGQTFGQVADRYLERSITRQSTRERVAGALKHARGPWGDRPINTIRRADAQALLNSLDLAPSTMRPTRTAISAVFAMAVNDEVIALNPFTGTKLPALIHGDIEPLTATEVRTLVDAAPAWFRVAVILGAACGLRQSETRGLTRDRVRLNELRVDRQATINATGWVPPKTKRSMRTIPVDQSVLTLIAHHLRTHGEGENGHVVHRNGRPLSAWMFQQAWQSTRRQAGLPDARYHDLRHHFASEHLGDGTSVIAVARMLGDIPAVVLSTYGHLVLADHDRVRATMRRLWDDDYDEDSVRTAPLAHTF